MDVHVSIGNSDDKLSQGEWALFCAAVENAVRASTGSIYGIWYSTPQSHWQNMCIAFGIDGDDKPLRRELCYLAWLYQQDSLAWLQGDTEFIKGVNPDGASR